MRGKWVLISVSVILLAIAAGALSILRKPAVEAPKKEEPKATETVLGDEIALMGKIQAAHIEAIPAPMDGSIDIWEVEPGQEVLEGQLLGHVLNSTLETTREQAQLELEKIQTKITSMEGQILTARLEASRADADFIRVSSEVSRLERAFRRQEMLLKEGATPRLTFEKAQKEYQASVQETNTARDLAKATGDRVAGLEKDLQLSKSLLQQRTEALEAAKEDLDAANLLSPADGVVIKLGVDQGGEINRGMRDLIQIAVDPAILELVVDAEPKVLAQMKAGLPALVLVPDVTSEGLSGEVREIKGKQIIVEFTSPNPAIKHGMTASVRIKVR